MPFAISSSDIVKEKKVGKLTVQVRWGNIVYKHRDAAYILNDEKLAKPYTNWYRDIGLFQQLEGCSTFVFYVNFGSKVLPTHSKHCVMCHQKCESKGRRKRWVEIIRITIHFFNENPENVCHTMDGPFYICKIKSSFCQGSFCCWSSILLRTLGAEESTLVQGQQWSHIWKEKITEQLAGASRLEGLSSWI